MRGRHEKGLSDLEARAWAVLRMLRQDKVWVDREGTAHIVSELEPRYASNIVGFLTRRAENLGFYYGFGQALQIDRWVKMFGRPDDFDIPVPEEEWEEQTIEPLVWLMKQPTYESPSPTRCATRGGDQCLNRSRKPTGTPTRMPHISPMR